MYSCMGKSVLNENLGSRTKPCYILNCDIMHHAIKRMSCNNGDSGVSVLSKNVTFWYSVGRCWCFSISKPALNLWLTAKCR